LFEKDKRGEVGRIMRGRVQKRAAGRKASGCA